MNLFDQLVQQALTNTPDLAPLQVVVEKELLHHDIMRILSETGLLQDLCFIGGTCLRTCYGSRRLSEDLDFTGGADFKREDFAALKENLIASLNDKYGLQVDVSEPTREEGNVDTWKLRVQTRPEARSLPAQKIHIDICAIPSYQPKPMTLLNPYGVDMGTEGLIVNAQSLEEIFVDKLLAFTLRRGRIKNRDLWDIAWLRQRTVTPAYELAERKLGDHATTVEVFLQQGEERVASLGQEQTQRDFQKEMRRFLPLQVVTQTVDNRAFWEYVVQTVRDHFSELRTHLSHKGRDGGDLTFLM
ncbi:nucleotidyl transferase AbiEii/AbiGii toxin family protein [Pseudomonas asiatica]|uniref:Nucleotidyl transferase AbiEii/AbiGii toxin family protein n=1 Tax=Pseudomonas asiatica TaxID=2219225 RepID=A0A9X4HYC8_9PSED|nr:nucleotidyl transferase AbiEii/AbiGii toxin family protein [Pseudomonas asiatica]MDD2110454.1 nucleotidyl transferase AbiEii/AbiGii toxin family protein [Pseudomonas asiatica]WJN51192.1 nucleotidyl transferase AbiEii/AbiGii toxin family protein [Pseudomonas asiatica]